MFSGFNNGETYSQQGNVAQFYLNYSRAYFDTFRIKENRLEIWPILFSIKNLENNKLTLDALGVIIKDEYDILLTPHIIRSRLLSLYNSGYILLNPEPKSIQDMKSNTTIYPTDKFSRVFSIHAAECAWRLLPSDEQIAYSPELESSINNLIHDMVKQHRIEWCLFVRDHLMEHCNIKNLVARSDFRKKITNEDVYWMAVLSAWRNHIAENNEFTFDDMNHWLNRRSYVAVETTRDVLRHFTETLTMFEAIKIRPHKKVYRIKDSIISILEEHIKNLENIRVHFDNACKAVLPSKKPMQ